MNEIVQFFRGMPQFFREAYNELRLSTWLSRKQVAATTVVAILFTAMISAYVGLVDWVLLSGIRIFLNPFRR